MNAAGRGVFRRGQFATVMPGTRVRPLAGPSTSLVPGIHVFLCFVGKTWMAGSSPAMTRIFNDLRAGFPREGMLEQNRNRLEPASVSQPAPIASPLAIPSIALSDLRQAVARLEGAATDLHTGDTRALPFGIASLDHALAGGLAPASLHEITPNGMTDLGSAIGFALALAARAHKPGKALFWITTDFAALEAGDTYGLGCDLAGLAARDLVVVKAARPIDALWAMEEALKCRALSCAVVELPNDAPLADLTATRRLTLAAREGGAFGFLLRHRASTLTSSAETRWRVAAARGEPDRLWRARAAPPFHSRCTKIDVARPATGHSRGTSMNVLSRRILSVWLRRLSTDRIERRGGLSGDAPLIVIEPVKSALRVAAMNDAAARLGLQTGMPLADVRAMHPGIGVCNADIKADRALLEAVADWCDRYTPLVGLDKPDGLMLDISGCAHLFGGEAALMQDMAARLFRQGLNARIAVADTAGCAWGVARYGNPLLVGRGETLAALNDLPLAALRIDDESVIALAQAGLKRIGDVTERPRAPLAARYGSGFSAPARSGARPRGGIDHAALAGAVLYGGAAFRRADRA